MNRFPRRVIATEAETHIRHAAAHFSIRQMLGDPARGVDEIDCVVVVLFNPGGDGKNIWIEDDVFGRELQGFGEQMVGALADFNFAFIGVGLPGFIERHHDDGGTVAQAKFGLAQEFGFAFFHGNRIHHRFALHTFQARFNHRPFGGIDHDRHP